MHRLDRIFKPQRIVLFGANENPKSVGSMVLRNLIGAGFRGVVYPVHPTLEAVLGIPCYRDPSALPKTPDLAVICTAAASVPSTVEACGRAGILGVVIISAGFREIGKEGIALEEEVREIVAKYDGMRIVGPNCLGVIVPGLGLNASFAADLPKPGHVAFVSQSGALCTSVLDWALEENVGFSCFVSLGNALDVEFDDLIDYLGEDEQTKAILLYVESIRDARRFMAATRAFARTKPIIAYKAGRFSESARAAASHTGAMAGSDEVYEAAFERSGVARVWEIGDIFHCVELLARYHPPRGPRLAIVTNAGGPGVMATDALIARNGVLAELSAGTIAALDESMPPFWSHGNPVDVLGDARAKRVGKATEIVLSDEGVDAVLVILTPQAMTDPTATARVVGELARGTSKPILAAWLGGRRMKEGIDLLNQAGIATYATPEEAVRAFITMVDYSKNLKSLYETPREIPVSFSVHQSESRKMFEETLRRTPTGVFSEEDSKTMLEAYGIPTSRPLPARDPREAVAAADQIGYPVVLKVLSPDITHKTEVGGVLLDLPDAEAVRRGFDRILESAGKASPRARLEGVTVQPMVRMADAVELILGVKKDPTFGAVLLVGTGGVATEIFADHALGLPPLNERLARRMLESLTAWPLLNGFRGKPPVDLNRLLEILIRFSYFVADFPEIAEIDINPLLASPGAVVALDARIVPDREILSRPVEPYGHMVLRPYPNEYVRQVELPDGTPLTLRPIRPEDEHLWIDLLRNCSPETIFSRFRAAVAWHRHDIATRYCFIDYDREIAIVGEIEKEGKRKLVGVGRLIADPGHETVEYAVLVADEFQNRGLGGILTDFCSEIALRWKLKRIVAETDPTNTRMIALFRNRDFHVREGDEGVVEVEKNL